MIYSELHNEGPQGRWRRVPPSLWVVLALAAGATPWLAATALTLGVFP
jgi:hypothetical protein